MYFTSLKPINRWCIICIWKILFWNENNVSFILLFSSFWNSRTYQVISSLWRSKTYQSTWWVDCGVYLYQGSCLFIGNGSRFPPNTTATNKTIGQRVFKPILGWDHIIWYQSQFCWFAYPFLFFSFFFTLDYLRSKIHILVMGLVTGWHGSY